MIIYYIKNNVNGKGYVGQHCGDKDSRWKQHLREALQVENPKPLYAAIRKYGIDNFTYSVLEEIPLSVGKKELDLREIYWIHNKNTYIVNGHGYNLTLGGGGQISAFCKTTETRDDQYNWGQYDKEGNLVKIWDTALEAAKALGINEFRHIYHAADWHIGKGKHGKTSGGFMWFKLKNGETFPNKITSFKELGKEKAKKLRKLTIPGSSTSTENEIAQYDVNGELVNVWPNNMRIPQKQLSIPYPAIMNSILGKSIFGYGYIWRRFRKGESPKKIETPQTLSGIGIEHNLFYDEKVVKLNLNNNQVLKKYDSINDIPIPFMSKIDVYQSIVGDKGHEWQFEKDYLRNSKS
jgi:group I intron endonuclease